MNANGHLLTLCLDCETAIAAVTSCLNVCGMKVMRTFDLRSACASLTDNTCPHHGTSPCDCQLVVLLVYGQEPVPASLVVHGHFAQTEFRLVGFPEMRPAPELEACITNALAADTAFPVNLSAWSDVT